MERIIGIDPSHKECGIVVIDNGAISSCFNVSSDKFYTEITKYLAHRNFIVVIEDLRPYATRLTQDVIDTAKFIGEAEYRLKCEVGANYKMIARNEVKKWAFDKFSAVCLPMIDEKIKKKGYVSASTGEARKASFVFVDDRIMTECMKDLYKIPLPKAGKGYQYGLKKHSWQALAVASCYIHRNKS